ncbi:unnamed protein product [Ambrosiozyma monospora]|uniref:Unnamed protein product n=1 Tax=Ambrosiozyma monospora TaxID=43982 RepID=A0ACB5TP50_AMBMO|nr:unnamed protein product [Ambrosiozyma monospora]
MERVSGSTALLSTSTSFGKTISCKYQAVRTTQPIEINQLFNDLKAKEESNPTIFETLFKLNLWHYTIQELQEETAKSKLILALNSSYKMVDPKEQFPQNSDQMEGIRNDYGQEPNE